MANDNQYSWLTQQFDSYLDPTYYEQILPQYNFNGRTDEQILEDYLESRTDGETFDRVVELGCGTGRGTEILQDYAEEVVAVDLKPEMLRIAKDRVG